LSLKKTYKELTEMQLEEGEAILDQAMFEGLKPADLYNIGRHVQEQKLFAGKVPASSLLTLVDFLSTTMEKDVMLALTTAGERRFIEVTALNPSRITKPVFKDAYASVAMSGTLSPLEAYVKMTAMPDDTLALKVPYPFPPENLRVLLTKGVSTRLEERNATLYHKIYRLLNAIEPNAGAPFGAAAFFASHELLKQFIDFLSNYSFVTDFLGSSSLKLTWSDIFVEQQFMAVDEIHRLFMNFVDAASRGRALLLAVQGGRLAEGVDYIANTLQTIIVVGVPYAKPTPRISKMIKVYQELFSNGRLYAYVIPALWSALQAAGRGIRGPNDVCTIIFMDRRFAKLKQLIPTWLLSQMKTTHIDRLEEALSRPLPTREQ